LLVPERMSRGVLGICDGGMSGGGQENRQSDKSELAYGLHFLKKTAVGRA